MVKGRFHFSWLHVYVGFVFLFLFAPLALVVLFSFNKTAALTFPFHGFSLRWYRDIFNSPEVLSAVFASFRVGLTTVAINTIIGTLAAIAITRYNFPLRRMIWALLLIPATLPGLFIGITLLSFFVQTHIPLSLWTVTIGHLVYTLPYFFLVANARLARFDPLLEQSAYDLGANSWQAFRKVTLPIIAPALVASALVTFTLSWDEVFITFFTIGNQNTLPLVIWSTVRHSIDPSINAISTLLLTGSIIFIFFVRRFVVEVQQ
jgi:spermidine/putrescine transport system permease protein